MIGIYKIINLKTNKVYIGQSIDIEKRWSDHQYRAKNLKYDTDLYKSIRKYGIENFQFEVLEECAKNELDDKERYWIEKYDSYKNGYNMTLGGKSFGEDDKANENKKIAVISYDLDGNFLKIYNSLSEASRETGANIYCIRQCLSGEGQSAKNMQWKKYEENYPLKINKYVKKKGKGKKIAQYDLENNLIQIFDSKLEAANKTGISRRSISRVCNGETKSCKGYIWKEIN